MPKISAIIPHWNAMPFLETCFTALRRQTFRDWKSIRVVNASQNGSVEYARRRFPEPRLVAVKENPGTSGGDTAGLELARNGPLEALIVLLTNDTEARPSRLEAFHQASHNFPKRRHVLPAT